MKNIAYKILALAAIVVSCSKVSPTNHDQEIKFVSSISTKVTASAFEIGDKISVWAVEQDGSEAIPVQLGGNYLNNEILTFTGSKWKSAQKLYWSDKPCDFIAVYPCIGTLTSVDRQVFSLELDQNAPEGIGKLSGYEAADRMVAVTRNVSRADGSVMLDFRHVLAKCSVNIVKGDNFEGDVPDDIVVHIYNTVVDYYLDLNKGTAGQCPAGSRKTITMHKKDNLHFDAIVVPQNIETNTPLIEVMSGGISYLLHYSMSFKPRYNHTINVILNTSPDQEKIEISIDPDLDEWEE